MHKIRHFILGTLLLSWIPLYSDVNYTDFSEESIKPKETESEEGRAFKITALADYVSKAKFSKSRLKGEHLQYSEFELEAGLIFYYNPLYDEGLGAALVYSKTHIDWRENPYFRQTNFNTASLSVGGFTNRICDWTWRAQAIVNIDTDHFNFEEYANYDMLFWGRYDYSDDIGVHVGLLGQTGMKIDRAYPILGFDWHINDFWQLNLVFPVNISLVYRLDKCWTFALAGRAFDSRHRANRHEPLTKAIVTYRTFGGELVASYDCDSWFLANIHAGYTFGGMLKIANRHYGHKHHLRFNPSPYVGAEAAIRF